MYENPEHGTALVDDHAGAFLGAPAGPVVPDLPPSVASGQVFDHAVAAIDPDVELVGHDASLDDAPEPASMIVAAAPSRPTTIRVLLVEELAEISRQVERLVEPTQGVRIDRIVTDGREALDAIRDSVPDVIVIDALLQGKVTGLRLARDLRAAGIDVPLVLLTVPERPLDGALVPGINEVMTMPLAGPGLVDTIERLHHAYRGARASGQPRTYVVHSGKSGVGKTTVAHNMAVAFAHDRAIRVALIDADLQFGDLRTLLDAPEHAPSMFELPVGHISDADVATVMWHERSGIDVLLSPQRVEQAAMIRVGDFGSIVTAVRRCYDIVVVDTRAVLDEMSLALFDTASSAIGVMTPHRSVVRHARRQEEALAAAGFKPDRFILALNRADPASVDVAAITRELGRPPQIVLPDEPRLSHATAEPARAFIDAEPDAPLSRSLVDFARILEHPTRAPVATAA